MSMVRMKRVLRTACAAGLAILLPAVPVAIAVAAQLNLRPGFNLFSVAQDVQVGKENAAQVEKELPILNDAIATRYVSELGRRLSGYALENQPQYVWQFKVVNSPDINAFALPGGYIYVNRATLESAQDEGQLAGVIAHEEGHVVLRHGTHQASELMLAQAPLAILGGFLGQNGSVSGKLMQYVGAAALQLALLRYSRGMEAQADAAGTYILYRAGYDPHAMAQFFQIIEQKYPQQAPQWLSNHPNPGNRIKAVDQEIPELGPPKSWTIGSPEFQAVKRHLLSLPPAPQPKPQSQG
jgi:beta-barrel assembly-enhancing protease